MKQIIENPNYTAQLKNYTMWGDLVEGGDRVEQNQTYLPQHAYESNPQYEIRLQLATYKNQAKPIVTVFTSSILRKPPVRNLPESLKQYEDDVDSLGTSAASFFRECAEGSAGVGVEFVVVDSAKVPEGENPINDYEKRSLGIRPYMAKKSARDVPAWGYDDDGLAFVVVKEFSMKDTGPFEEPEEIKQYRIWYRNMWELWTDTDKTGIALDSAGEHPCGEVPVKPLYFRKKGELVGESCIKDVASLLKRAYMMENALDKSLFDTAFPQQYFFGFSGESIDGYIKASSNGLVNEQHDAKTGFVEPSGKSFDALDSKVKRDEISIREIALRMVRPDSKVGESAESKKIDRQQLNSQLAVFSQNCEDVETWAWEMMLKWDNASGDVEIEYNRDFDVDEISGELLDAFSKMRENGDLSRQTYWDILKKQEVPFPEDFDYKEELKRIVNEKGNTNNE